MKRLHVWLYLSAAGFLYWGVKYRFAASGIDQFAGPFWFGGMALLLHWFTNRTDGVALDAPRPCEWCDAPPGTEHNSRCPSGVDLPDGAQQ